MVFDIHWKSMLHKWQRKRKIIIFKASRRAKYAESLVLWNLIELIFCHHYFYKTEIIKPAGEPLLTKK